MGERTVSFPCQISSPGQIITQSTYWLSCPDQYLLIFLICRMFESSRVMCYISAGLRGRRGWNWVMGSVLNPRDCSFSGFVKARMQCGTSIGLNTTREHRRIFEARANVYVTSGSPPEYAQSHPAILWIWWTHSYNVRLPGPYVLTFNFLLRV